jgi:DNA-binding transcriptional MerR regulator
MDELGTLKVGAVARMAGVTIRTLHHYDEIGLLRPTGRTDAGYRRYGPADLERLQRILFYRELEFGLDQIKDAMVDDSIDALVHLRRQHALLEGRIERLRRLSDAVAKAMEARQMGINLTPQERLEVFGSHDPDQYAAEVEERWGDTDAYRESTRRARSYTRDDWNRIKAEGQQVNDRLVAAMHGGLPATGPEAMSAAEAHRQQISTWFYPCSREMHVNLAEMYLADPRFTATYETIAEGLAQYVHDAIVANAATQGGTAAG